MSDLPATTRVVRDAQIIDPPRAPSDMTDAELGAAAAKAVDDHLAMRAGSIEAAIRAGELLIEARRRCPDEDKGSWGRWLGLHWPKSRTTAQRYIALANEAQGVAPSNDNGLPYPRADRRAALLALPSVRAALTDAGYDAGGTRDEPEGMRSPGADEDEDANTPDPANLNAPTRAEQAVIDNMAAKQAAEKRAAEDAERARKNKWVAGQRRKEQEAANAPEPTEEEKAAEREAEATKKAERQRELDAIEAARNRPRGPEAPVSQPDPQAELPVSVAPVVAALANEAKDLARRIGLFATNVAAVKRSRIESLDFLTTGKPDPRDEDWARILKVAGPLFGAAVAAEKVAPLFLAHGDMDSRAVEAELSRLAEQYADDQAAMAALSATRKGA